MESGGGSNNQDGRSSRTPPDEQQMRIGRSRVARGFDALAEENAAADASSGLIGAGAGRDAPLAPGSRLPADGTAKSEVIDATSRYEAWSDKGQAGAAPLRCHFLRSVGADGRLADPQKTAVPTHRCAAYGDPLPLSLRQQELVCLQRVHVSCPRYVRGTLLANENQAQSAPHEGNSGGVPILAIAGAGLAILAILGLVGGVMGIGPLAGGSASHRPIAGVSASASPRRTTAPSLSASPTASSSATAAASPTVTPTILPTAPPTVRPTATPRATASWPPGATASRMNLVVPCTGQTKCYVYTVRGGGPPPAGNGSGTADNLAGIENFFGVKATGIYALNPGVTAKTILHAGQHLKIPPPTK